MTAADDYPYLAKLLAIAIAAGAAVFFIIMLVLTVIEDDAADQRQIRNCTAVYTSPADVEACIRRPDIWTFEGPSR